MPLINPRPFQIFKETYNHLPQKNRRQFSMLIAAMICLAGFESLTVIVISAFLAVVANPIAIQSNRLVTMLKSHMSALPIETPEQMLLAISLLVILVVAIQTIIRFFVINACNIFAGRTADHFGKKVLQGYMDINFEWLLSKSPADLMPGIMWRKQTGNMLRSGLKLLVDVFIVSLMIALIIVAEPMFATAFLIGMGLFSGLLSIRLRKYLRKSSRRLRDLQLQMNLNLQKSIHGIRDIRVYNHQERSVAAFDLDSHQESRLLATQLTLSQSSNWFMEFIGLALLSAMVITLIYGLRRPPADAIAPIALIAAAAWRLIPAFSRLIQNMNAIQVYLPFVETVLGRLNDVKTNENGSDLNRECNQTAPLIFNHSICFDKISFSYKTGSSARRALDQISFRIKKGDSVGIVGRSGAGKSTLVNLILGLLSPSSGRILIDDMPLDSQIRPAWMRKVGYVPQSPYICAGTLAENIAFGYSGEEINEQQVKTCCQMAAIDEFLPQLPHSINTQVGERGVKLSGGQQQRVAIARALYHNPSVLIFDEATSSLDSKTERAIQETISSLKGQRTVIIIAHRLSTLKDCDLFIWLEDGKLFKAGNSVEILSEYHLFQEQNSATNIG